MKKFLQGFCFVVALVFVLFVDQSVNANVVKGHVEKVQGRTCSCGGTLVVRSKIVTKPGPDDCYHCHGNGYNIINKKNGHVSIVREQEKVNTSGSEVAPL